MSRYHATGGQVAATLCDSASGCGQRDITLNPLSTTGGPRVVLSHLLHHTPVSLCSALTATGGMTCPVLTNTASSVRLTSLTDLELWTTLVAWLWRHCLRAYCSWRHCVTVCAFYSKELQLSESYFLLKLGYFYSTVYKNYSLHFSWK